MSATANKTQLSHALGNLARLTGSKINPDGATAQGKLRIQFTPEGLTLSARHDMTAQLTVPAEVSFDMHGKRVVVGAELVSQLVHNAPGTTVQFLPGRGELGIVSGQSKVAAQTYEAPDEAFEIYASPIAAHLVVQTADLDLAVNGVQYAASHEAFQAVFRGLLLEGTGDTLRLVASDGYRVAIADLPHPTPTSVHGVVHASYWRDAMRFLEKTKDVALALSGTNLTWRAEGVTLTAPRMDGDFPDYRKIIPTPAGHITVPADQFKASVARVAILADKNANNRVSLTVTDQGLEVYACGDYGSGRDFVQARSFTGECRTFAANARMLLDVLATMSGDVQVGLTNSVKPLLFTSDAPGVQGILVTLRD